jgi:hypothetical protein
MEDLRIPPGPGFQITKHLNLADLAQGAIFFRWVFWIWGSEGGSGPAIWLHEILNDDFHLLCKSLDLDFKSYMFVLLVFYVCSNGKRRGGNSIISSDCLNSVDSTRIVGELKYFNVLYHVLSYRCIYIYMK